MQSSGTFQFQGVEIPAQLLERTGSGAEHFEHVARQHLAQYESFAPIAPDHRVFELASGIGRDALLLTSILDGRGAYDGVDLDKPSIRWCQKAITGRWPNFRFHHANLRSSQYNPYGFVRPSRYRFPVRDASVDRALAQSLFTHLLPDATARYFAETRRVLRPDGLAVYTILTGSEEEILASANSSVTFFRITHPHSPGVYLQVPEIPESGVAYSTERLAALLKAAGLELARPVIRGCWIQGRTDAAEHAQDLLILRRSG